MKKLWPIRVLYAAWLMMQRYGPGFFTYVLTGVLVPKLAYHTLYRMAGGIDRARRVLRLLTLGVILLILAGIGSLWSWSGAVLSLLVLAVVTLLAGLTGEKLKTLQMQRLARELTYAAKSGGVYGAFTSWEELPLENSTRKAIDQARGASPDQELTIGQVGEDGRLLGLYGGLPDWGSAHQASSAQGKRCGIDVVLVGDHVLVRKDFRGHRGGFVQEWYKLATLAGKANVPAIYDADEDCCVLYTNLVPGRSIGQGWMEEESQRTGRKSSLRSEAATNRGMVVGLPDPSERLLRALEQQLDALHACGVAGVDIGSILVDSESGRPWFVDSERARVYRSTSSLAFAFARDQDRNRFNQAFGQTLMTERSARAALAAQAAEGNWYAPIDFGGGLSIGRFWAAERGTGRWEFLNRHVVSPLVAGKRVLDLGSNNGILPMMMLRAGAREVVAVEKSPLYAQSAELVRRIFEWRDISRYALQVYNGDMLDILHQDWGEFDVVTAFCSLYYLEPGDMARVVRRASELVPLMVLQANTGKGRGKTQKASTAFLKRLLEENGFPHVQVFAPARYSRPLLVGRATDC